MEIQITSVCIEFLHSQATELVNKISVAMLRSINVFTQLKSDMTQIHLLLRQALVYSVVKVLKRLLLFLRPIKRTSESTYIFQGRRLISRQTLISRELGYNSRAL